MLDRESEAHIPALRDRVMMGAHAPGPGLPTIVQTLHLVPPAATQLLRQAFTQLCTRAGEMSMYEAVTLQDAEAAALAGRPWPPVSEADAAAGTGPGGSAEQLPTGTHAHATSGAVRQGAQVDEAAPMVGPLLPGGSYLAGEATPDAAPAAMPQVGASVAVHSAMAYCHILARFSRMSCSAGGWAALHRR
jgi:hypothetical protein